MVGYHPSLRRKTRDAVRRHTNLSRETIYDYETQWAVEDDAECMATPTRIRDLILPNEIPNSLFIKGHGTAPDLICAKGVPDIPSLDPSTFNRKKCNIFIIEIGFCRDFGCDIKLQEKTDTYAPLFSTFKDIWGKMEFVAIPITHASTTLTKTHHCLAQFASPIRNKTRDSARTSKKRRHQPRNRLRNEDTRLLPLQVHYADDANQACKV